ncbi:MAG: ferric reductase-like transmembrane domain-containing protein [Hyphomonadaceae bacterium]|nr:ferric reductase-like transmembrane domain-containing protein [Hyphomonadaceae bacterium]
MSHDYKAVQSTPFKKRFDLWLLIGIALYLVGFIAVSFSTQPAGESLHPVQVVIRATGTLAFLLLTFILCIGPLARFTDRFKPFLYNRRHLGVTTFLIALMHAALTIMWYHGFSETNPLVSVFISNPRYDSLSGFPFESLGFVALIILFLMAATSHDFWNANLGPGLWKTLHMGVYFAYAALVLHVALGAIQFNKDPIYVGLLAASAVTVIGLHLISGIAGLRSSHRDGLDGWLKVAAVADMEDARAKIIRPAKGEAIAVFRDGEKISAVSNVCRHQGGPLGEGKIVDGCITCPWHGFQYRMQDGQSPPPFTEKIATYATRIVDGVVYVNPEPNAPGTPQTPSQIGASA